MQKVNALKVLMIGNSFSEDTVPYMPQIAKSVGMKDFEIGTLMIGGCTLATHFSNSKSGAKNYNFFYFDKERDCMVIDANKALIDGFTYSKWDFITIQQASHLSGKEETYNQDLNGMLKYIKEHNPNSKLVWNMTWAYAKGYSGLESYNNDQMQMYSSIIKTVQNKIETNENFFTVSPAGTAIQNGRTSYIGDGFNRDGTHLSLGLGRFISGLTLFCLLTGYSPYEINFKPEQMTEKEFEVAKESVDNALKNKYSVTQSKYKSKD